MLLSTFPTPFSTLKEIHRVLKRGSHLVLETPRYDTLMFKLLGRRERSVSCGGRVFYFFTTASSGVRGEGRIFAVAIPMCRAIANVGPFSL